MPLGAQLRAEGWDVSVYGVPAYSTLGWSNWIGGDPLLNTFVNGTEGELARLIFHELAHQVIYVADDTLFNESFATAVERIGTRLWLQQHGSEAVRTQYREAQQRRQDFRELTMRYRDQLEAPLRQRPQRRGQARRQGRVAGAVAYRVRADEAAALGRLCRLRRVVRQRQQCRRWACWPPTPNWPVTSSACSFSRAATSSASMPDVAEIGALPKAQRHATLRAIP